MSISGKTLGWFGWGYIHLRPVFGQMQLSLLAGFASSRQITDVYVTIKSNEQIIN